LLAAVQSSASKCWTAAFAAGLDPARYAVYEGMAMRVSGDIDAVSGDLNCTAASRPGMASGAAQEYCVCFLYHVLAVSLNLRRAGAKQYVWATRKRLHTNCLFPLKPHSTRGSCMQHIS